MGKDGILVKVLFNGNALDLKCSYFKMIMATNSEQFMRKKSIVNHVMRLWTKINSSFMIKHKLSKFMKLDEFACAQVLGSMEDKICLFVVAFMKNKLRNHLTCHLDLHT